MIEKEFNKIISRLSHCIELPGILRVANKGCINLGIRQDAFANTRVKLLKGMGINNNKVH